MEVDYYKRFPEATTRPMLVREIQDALKKRQNVELVGDAFSVGKLLGDLMTYVGGKEMILPQHEEDYAMQIISNIAFIRSDKMSLEHIMRQVLQSFGWPPVSSVGLVSFYFAKLLKLLHYERVIPIFLIEHPEIVREKSFTLLQILSEYAVDRTPVGIPSVICLTDRYTPSSPISRTCFVVELLRGQITEGEITGIIEEISPGSSPLFKYDARLWLKDFPSTQSMKVKIKEILVYKDKLGLEYIDMDVVDQWGNDKNKKRSHAKTHD